MRRGLRLAFVVFTWIAIVPPAAYAQASITGVVRDTSGAVLPGVTVEAASPVLIEKVRTAVTDGTGRYRIEELRPGLYAITFTLPGFATVRREGIQLTGTFVATVNAEMRVGALEETVTVTGETPLVDVQSVTHQHVVDEEVLNVLPAGGTPFGVISLLPGITHNTTRPDVGGLAGDGNARGGTSTRGVGDTQVMIGNVSLKTAGAPPDISGTVMNLGAYQEVVVDTGGLGAERSEGGLRVSLIPRDGGNTFSGFFHGSFATSGMQGNNFTQDLRDRGLGTPNRLKKLWEFNPGVGGPIKRDRVWFHWTMRHAGAFQNVPMFFNKHAGNPQVWTYEPDTSRPYGDENTVRNWTTLRLTWQATQRNKIGFIYDASGLCDCPRGATAIVAPEANITNYVDLRPRNSWVADWTAPVTNRLLLQATTIRRWSFTDRPQHNLFIPRGLPPMIAVHEQSTDLRYRASPTAFDTRQGSLFGNVILSHVAGAHAFKVGYDYGFGSHNDTRFSPDAPMEFRFRDGVPNRITLHARPFTLGTRVVESGLFVQDRWTVARFTVTLGLRYDYFRSWYPEMHVGPAELVPDRNIVLPRTNGVTWHNILPNSGLALDLFGDGKTALKVSLGKYLAQHVIRGPVVAELAPANRLVNSTTRSWNDANRNFVPDCDVTNPAANGECGPMANSNFGSTQPGVTIDPDLVSGWGKTEYHWQFSTGVQRELLPRVSMEVTYWRTWYGNFLVTDNRAVGPSDHDAFTITAPLDPRLPGGGGYVISGLYNIKPQKFGVPADDFLTFAHNYGKQTEYWNGVDVMFQSRPRAGVLLQGGTSTGRESTDDCAVVTKVDNPSPLYCHVKGTFRTQAKFLASYTIPRIDVQVSGNFQRLPGPQITANYVASNAEVRPSLGRNLAGGERNVTVNLVEPRTRYGERRNQLDLRVGKILRFGRTRATATVDLYNALNSSAVLGLSNAFATWQRPQAILPARFAKVGLQFEF